MIGHLLMQLEKHTQGMTNARASLSDLNIKSSVLMFLLGDA